MTDSSGAFLKLEMAPEVLHDWLAAAPPDPGRWDDWRGIGGRFYFDGGVDAPEDLPEAEYRGYVARAGNALAEAKTNRGFLARLVASAERPAYGLAAWNAGRTVFLAGSLTWSETLPDYIAFLAFARGAMDFLDPGRHGLAVILDFLLAERATLAALSFSAAHSRLMGPEERGSAGAGFDALAETLAAGRRDADWPPVRLDTLP